MKDYDQHIPTLSVCIATFNVEKYLSNCLQSLTLQSYMDCEFIIVDDASNDRTIQICKEFILKDNRFRLIQHDRNLGSLAVRKTGILEAKGQYITFLDGDDFYTTSTSLTTIVQKIEDTKCDILRFENKNVDAHGKDISNPHPWHGIDEPNRILTKLEAMDLILGKAKCSWCLWTHIYKTNVLKRAALQLPDIRAICGEDTLILFWILYYSKSFIAIKTGPVYSYRVGTGISTTKVSLSTFSEFAKQPLLIDEILKKLNSDSNLEIYKSILLKLCHFFLNDLVYRYLDLPDNDKILGFQLLEKQKYWFNFLDTLRLVDNKNHEIIKFLNNYDVYKSNNGINNVLLFTNNTSELNINLLINIINFYTSKNNKITIIYNNSDILSKLSFLNNSLITHELKDSTPNRYELLNKILINIKYDTVFYFDNFNPSCCYDFIFFKSLKKNIIVFELDNKYLYLKHSLKNVYLYTFWQYIFKHTDLIIFDKTVNFFLQNSLFNHLTTPYNNFKETIILINHINNYLIKKDHTINYQKEYESLVNLIETCFFCKKEINYKKINIFKVIKYAIKSKISFSRRKRKYYRNKLFSLFIS